MRLLDFQFATVRYYWRTHLATVVGVIAGTSALTGALLVGDSMRGSLADQAVSRLGRVTHAVVPPHDVRAELAVQIMNDAEFSDRFDEAQAVLMSRGSASHASSHALARNVTVMGVPHSFWDLHSDHDVLPQQPFGAEKRSEAVLHRLTVGVGEWSGRSVVLNESLAAELSAAVGDDVLVRVPKIGVVSAEMLLGRRDEPPHSLRLKVVAIVDNRGVHSFGLNVRQSTSHVAFVPLETLQQRLDRPGRANTLLFAAAIDAGGDHVPAGPNGETWLQNALAKYVTLDDLGLTLRKDESRRYAALECERFLLEPAIEQAANSASQRLEIGIGSVLTYLANEISLSSSDARIPYSTVAAVDGHISASLSLIDGTSAPAIQLHEILLNEWAAADLKTSPGEEIELSYYVTAEAGQLKSVQSTFTLRGVVALTEIAADPGLTPTYRALTDTENIADWNPPFPVDLNLVRQQDEEYWDRYRATPKAFINLADGQALWSDEPDRFGKLTSIRIMPAADADFHSTVEAFRHELVDQLDLPRLGLEVSAVRAKALRAAAGSTDFAGLFIGFSFFVIVAAALLVALLFRLAVELRAHELGLLGALGYSRSMISRSLLFQGFLITAPSALIGLLAAVGYAWLMLAGLRTWWIDAVHAPFLQLHVSWSSLVIGYVVSVVVALASVAWSIRGMTKLSARNLIAGVVQAIRPPVGNRRAATIWLAIAMGLGIALWVSSLTGAVPDAAAFFGMGSAALFTMLLILHRNLLKETSRIIDVGGWGALARLGWRNTRRNARRSVLTVSLMAAATFVISALQAFRIDASSGGQNRESGDGGFVLYAESAASLNFDLNDPSGRDSLGLSIEAAALLADAHVESFRLRPGDDSSCLNLYVPQDPRIVGAREQMLNRGGFQFAATLAKSDAERQNPWLLLKRTFPDGAIPAIGDQAAVKWQLHLGMGKDLVITDERGHDVTLRFVALLQGSALQDEIIVTENQFVKIFPSIAGYGFFLIQSPTEQRRDQVSYEPRARSERSSLSTSSTETLAATLEHELANYGFDVARTADRLSRYAGVQNTYLATFQTLGGVGLILGTMGLSAVMLRNVYERRGELALMRALGFSKRSLAAIVMFENASLIAVGLAVGTISAAMAVGPELASRPASLPLFGLGLTLAGTALVGLTAGALALIPMLRASLLQSLRTE